jgi:NDP-sugar pyrophosphorylase family protein
VLLNNKSEPLKIALIATGFDAMTGGRILQVKKSELFAYKHHGFWKPMDKLRDNMQLMKFGENY